MAANIYEIFMKELSPSYLPGIFLVQRKTGGHMREATRLEIQLSNSPPDTPIGSVVPRRRIGRTIFSVAAALGIFGGIAALGFGLFCAVAHDVVPDDLVLSRLSTVS